MKQTRANILLVTAAAAAVSSLVFTQSANAQYPAANADGHANDANNRVGSGGYNTPRTGGSNVTSNDIVYRNVTGGRGFSGPVESRDPRAFTGPTAGHGVDVFNRQSNGVPTDAGAISNPYQPQPFYGDSRFVAPPSGALPLGFNGGYVGTTLTSPSALSNGLSAGIGSNGLQSRTESRDNLLLNAMLNPSGYSGLATTNQQGDLLQAASLYGQHTLSLNEGEYTTTQLPDRLAPDDSAILKMRQELRDASGPLLPDQQSPTPRAGQSENGAERPTGLNQPLNQPLNQSFDAPSSSALGHSLNSPLNSAVSSTGTIPDNVHDRPSLIPASAQSTLLDSLQKRLEKTTGVGKAMAEARADHPQPANPPAKTTNKPLAGQAASPSEDEGPLKVSRLATGVKAKGLHDLLASGEDLTSNAKFDSAIAKFNQAQRVAPNNPLAVLGRAHAELGGGYYARAEQDLRLVFLSDPELLMAQFDLNSVLPKDRAEHIRSDLKSLAQSDAKAERPWFLLAYLDYNTNRSASAEIDLNECEQRAGHSDWAVRQFRQHWTLPAKMIKPSTPAPASDGTTPAPAPSSTETPALPPKAEGTPELNK